MMREEQEEYDIRQGEVEKIFEEIWKLPLYRVSRWEPGHKRQ